MKNIKRKLKNLKQSIQKLYFANRLDSLLCRACNKSNFEYFYNRYIFTKNLLNSSPRNFDKYCRIIKKSINNLNKKLKNVK